MSCILCGAQDAVLVCEGDAEAACAEKMAAWRPTGILPALGEPVNVEDGQPTILRPGSALIEVRDPSA